MLKHTFAWGYAAQLWEHIPWEGSGIQLLAYLAPSIQIIGSLMRIPWLAKQTGKMKALN